MHFSTSTALVATFAGLAVANPIDLEDRSTKAFTVKQVAAGKKNVVHPAVQVMNAYHKFAKAGAKAPANVKSAAAAAASGSVVATPESNDEVGRFFSISIEDFNSLIYRLLTFLLSLRHISRRSPLAERH